MVASQSTPDNSAKPKEERAIKKDSQFNPNYKIHRAIKQIRNSIDKVDMDLINKISKDLNNLEQKKLAEMIKD